MALSDGNGSDMVMPVAPMYGGGGGAFGGLGNDGWWILLLLLFAGNGGWGFGGFGGGFGGLAADGAMLYPWMNQSNQINNGFRDQMIDNSINSIQSGINGIGNQLCNGFAGVNATINSGFANAETAANARQIANLQQAFNAQTAVTAGMTDLAMGLQNCCCENRASVADLKYTVATEACADRAVVSDALRDVITANTASTQRILDQMCQDKIDAKNEKIAELQNQLTLANFAASQNAQTAAILTDNLAQTNALEQYLAPVPRPAYVVQNPNCCANFNGCGCN